MSAALQAADDATERARKKRYAASLGRHVDTLELLPSLIDANPKPHGLERWTRSSALLLALMQAEPTIAAQYADTMMYHEDDDEADEEHTAEPDASSSPAAAPYRPSSLSVSSAESMYDDLCLDSGAVVAQHSSNLRHAELELLANKRKARLPALFGMQAPELQLSSSILAPQLNSSKGWK